MQLELPAELQHTANILRNSMKLNAQETAPALPADLFQDLASRFSPQTAPAAPAKASIFEKARSFFATPAFGMSAVALVILAVALPSVMNTTETTSFRGNATTAADEETVAAPASIVLIRASDEVVSALKASGDFEKGSILTSDTAKGAKVTVNFGNQTIVSKNAAGDTLYIGQIPADPAALNDAIATAIARLY